MNNYTMYNTNNVLQELEKLIYNGKTVKIRDVCDELSIFDWWLETLPISKMRQMQSFFEKCNPSWVYRICLF